MPLTLALATTQRDARHAAQTHLAQLLDTPHPLLFLSSGGSAFELLSNAQLPISRNLTLGVLDERFSTDPAVNNFAQLTQTMFFQRAVQSGAPTIDTRIKPEETATQLALRFESALHTWRQQHPKGKIVASIGIGPDAHIAGIFPHRDRSLFDERFLSKNLVTTYDAHAHTPFAQRITTTATFLLQLSEAVIYACGNSKESALKQLKHRDTPWRYPVQLLHQLPNATLFTDQPITL